MSYLLSYSLVSYVQASSQATKTRLNLAAQIQGTVRAKAKNKILKKAEEVALFNDLNIIDDKIEQLRRSYEPYIDVDSYSYDKAGIFEKLLDEVTEEQKIIIERFKLISKEDIAGMTLTSPIMSAGSL